PFTFVSSGREWLQESSTQGPFIELAFERTSDGTRTGICLETVEEARQLLTDAERALEHGSGASEIDRHGISITATPELSSTLRRAIRLHDERLESERREGETPTGSKSQRYSAIIHELSATVPIDHDGIVIDESQVPWSDLEALMRPEHRLKV